MASLEISGKLLTDRWNGIEFLSLQRLILKLEILECLSQGRSDFERDILESEAVQFVILINICSTHPCSAEDYLTP